MGSTDIAAEAGMLIRRPVKQVFGSLLDPNVTTKFWFTRSTGKLEAGKRVRWEWEMYDQAVHVDVDEVTENERIVMRWPAYEGDAQTTVEWHFTPENTTFVRVTNTGFSGDEEAVARQAVAATGGFTLVLAGMKAWLEHGIELDLIRDRFPEESSISGSITFYPLPTPSVRSRASRRRLERRDPRSPRCQTPPVVSRERQVLRKLVEVTRPPWMQHAFRLDLDEGRCRVRGWVRLPAEAGIRRASRGRAR